MDEWNQQRADNRDMATMRQIAVEAQQLGDDWLAFEKFAAGHGLTVNEVVYYLNAYEYGGEAGLRAIHAPEIIPSDLARRAIKQIAETLDHYFQGRLPYRLTDEGIAIGLYEIKQRWRSQDKYLFAICQFRLTTDPNRWHLYWMRKFDAWWPYSPPQAGRKYTLRARIQQLIEDEDGCFWG
jgi:hypothetical protein